MSNTRSATSIEQAFEPTGFVMIRTPLLPVDRLRTLFEFQPPTSSSTTGDSLSAQSYAVEYSRLQMEAYLEDMLSDAAVREAILVGSPDLFQAISYWERSPSSKKGRNAQGNLLRYLIRMSTRPTPFGLFAGVETGHVGLDMNVRVGPRQGNRKRARPDMRWLLHRVRTLEQHPEVIDHLRFFTNPSLFVSAERLYIPHLGAYGQAEAEKTVSLRATPIVLSAIELARRGISLSDLKRQLLIERPTATEAQVQTLLDGLRQNEVLLSDLRPPLTGGDPTQYVLHRLKEIPGGEELVQDLANVLASSEIYESLALGEGTEIYETLLATTQVSGSPLRSTMHVDMRTTFDTATFSIAVTTELAKAVEAIYRVSTATPQFRHLAAYRREFIERYGEEREVYLLELLDEDIGLGPPPTYQHPIRKGESPVLPPLQYPNREVALLDIAVTSLRDNRHEVELDEDTLERLQVHDSWRTVLPSSVEIYASVAAPSQVEINNGNYLVVIGPRIGAYPAGRSFGRFCHILGSDTTQAITKVARHEEEQDPDRIFAELVYLPKDGHAANVSIRPVIRRFEVSIAATPGVAQDETLPLNDLVVGIRDDRFYLRSVSRDAEVVIRSTHLLNYIAAPNVCRFLEEVSIEGVIPIHDFDWGTAINLPCLPRVRVGRVIIRPA